MGHFYFGGEVTFLIWFDSADFLVAAASPEKFFSPAEAIARIGLLY
jgi:hypothetical protein